MATQTAPMDKDEFVAWMSAWAFNDELLSEALHVHPMSIVKWRNGKYPLSYTTYLALRYLEGDRKAHRARRKALDALQQARRESRARTRPEVDGAMQRAHEATLDGVA